MCGHAAWAALGRYHASCSVVDELTAGIATLRRFAPFRRRFAALIVGDEAFRLVYRDHRGRAVSASWKADDHGISAVVERIGARCRHPLNILVDTIDQSYRSEKVPPSPRWDRAKIVQRRLGMAFPDAHWQRAIKLSDDDKGSSYLLVGLPHSSLLNALFEALSRQRVEVAGVSLLPLEVASSLKSIIGRRQPAVDQTGGALDHWQIVVARQSTGGVRQIVLRNGALALTRLTENLVERDDTTQIVSQAIRDVQATTAYLARLGFDRQAQLSVHLVGDRAMADHVAAMASTPFPLEVIDGASIFAAVGATGEAAGDSPYLPADTTLGAFFAVTPLHHPLDVGWITRQRRIRSLRWQAMAGGGAASIAIALWAGSIALEVSRLDQRIATWQVQAEDDRRTAAELGQKLARSGQDVALMRRLIVANDVLARGSDAYRQRLDSLLELLADDIRLAAVDWQRQEVEQDDGGARRRRPIVIRENVLINLNLDRARDVDDALQKTETFAHQLEQAFSGSAVEIRAQPLHVLATDTLSGGVEAAPSAVARPLDMRSTLQLTWTPP